MNKWFRSGSRCNGVLNVWIKTYKTNLKPATKNWTVPHKSNDINRVAPQAHQSPTPWQTPPIVHQSIIHSLQLLIVAFGTHCFGVFPTKWHAQETVALVDDRQSPDGWSNPQIFPMEFSTLIRALIWALPSIYMAGKPAEIHREQCLILPRGSGI